MNNKFPLKQGVAKWLLWAACTLLNYKHLNNHLTNFLVCISPEREFYHFALFLVWPYNFFEVLGLPPHPQD